MPEFDVVITGAGLGGLLCGTILGREGLRVCVIEKNHTAGGCLQSFTRDGSIFDTGMHYSGFLDDGSFLNNFLNNIGILKDLKLRRLDEDGYDVIRYSGSEYKFPMGYDRFCDELGSRFPEERQNLEKYISRIKEIGNSIERLTQSELQDAANDYVEFYGSCFSSFLENTFQDPVLRNVIAGMNMLYAGQKGRTPLYIPMMIHSSFLNGAYRFTDGGSQLSDLLCREIKACGGTIVCNAEVTGFTMEDSGIVAALAGNKTIAGGRYFISDIHPKKIVEIAGERYFKPAYIRRINNLKETCGMFTLYLSSSGFGFPYINRNFYSFSSVDTWNAVNYSSESWPEAYMVHFTPVSQYNDRTNTVIVNTPMRWDEVSRWSATNTGKRGREYEDFKRTKAEKLIGILNNDFPEITSSITSYYTSTPLTYRDYTGTAEGSAYGILRDCNRPFETMILPSTHIRNLYLTGQNTNTHGVVGVTVSALMTCAEILGKDYLFKKIAHG